MNDKTKENELTNKCMYKLMCVMFKYQSNSRKESDYQF